MSVLSGIARGRAPEPGDLLPLSERLGYVEALRVALATIVLTSAALRPGMRESSLGRMAVVSILYLCLSGLPHVARRVEPGRRLPFLKAMLLVDGIYLAWVVSLTGGADSPLRALFFIEIIMVTLLVSYRTGLKLTAWCSLLYLGVAQAGAMAQSATAASARGSLLGAALTVVGMWVVALTTATFSAIAEGELRRQKADLGSLARMSMELEEASSAEEIPSILLRTVCETFGFSRGVVLASPEGDLALKAAHGVEAPTVDPGLDRMMELAWARHEPQLARRLEPASDPRLATLFPDAHNVIVVPMFINRGYRLGILALEHRSDQLGMRRWQVSMLVQFATQASLALHNAWLAEERQRRLEEISGLQRELKVHNARLEMAVSDRTEELRRTVDHLEQVDEERRRLLSHVVTAQEEERTRIANDIHDDPLQKLVAMKMRMELLRRTNDPAEAAELHELVLSCIKSLRFLLFDLRPPVLDEQGLGPAIQRAIERWETETVFGIEDDLLIEIPPDTRVILYRIAQEALANVRKHAQAAHVQVKLEASQGGALMRISDDGVGCAPEEALASRAGHLGLVAIRERAEIAGGRCSISSLPGAGTTVEVWLPFPEQRESGAEGPLSPTQGHNPPKQPEYSHN